MNENWMFKNLDRSGNSDQQLTIVRGWEATTNQTQNQILTKFPDTSGNPGISKGYDDHLQRIQSLEATDQEKIVLFVLYISCKCYPPQLIFLLQRS